MKYLAETKGLRHENFLGKLQRKSLGENQLLHA